MKTIIAGYLGEVGRALYEILQSHYEVEGVDIKGQTNNVSQDFDILHIAIPYGEGFEEQVDFYQKTYKPKFTIIHSTVPVGTSQKLNAIHSPIRGLHPNLAEGIRTFPKFIGGKQAYLVADYFRRAGLKVVLCDTSEETELGKLCDTEYYRACIEFMKRVKGLCDTHKVPFHTVYTLFNQTYNTGYTQLGYPEYVRPVLQPIMTEKIGGHCVEPNSKLL